MISLSNGLPNRVILASSSPRRIEILNANGVNHVVIPPEIDENIPMEIKPRHAAMFLALKKALYVESVIKKDGLGNGEIILAADTIVVYGGKTIGKPANSKEAFDILKTLCGKAHEVITGVAILKPGKLEKNVFYEVSKVFFKEYTDAEIIEYIRTPEPYDKAGGYAAQGLWRKNISRVEGDLDNVIGLPWNRISPYIRAS